MIDRSIGHVFSRTKTPKRRLLLLETTDFPHAEHYTAFMIIHAGPIQVACLRNRYFERMEFRCVVDFRRCAGGPTRLEDDSSFRKRILREQLSGPSAKDLLCEERQVT